MPVIWVAGMKLSGEKANTMSIKMLTPLSILLLLVTLSPTQACPESCFCVDTFVTCSDFQFLDLTLLPPGTDTLVLSKGEVEEIPPGFLAMATQLKMLEIMNVNARVVRGSAFRGLSNLDLLTISGSSFDIVEPDSFIGLSNIGKILITDSKFGRVGKHAFAEISSILEIRMWSNTFDTISDEAFYKLEDIISFQFYQNNITFIGSNVFLGASEIDDCTIYMNNIQTMSEGSFEHIATVASRMVLHANLFQCSCDNAWILSSKPLREFLRTNKCRFPGSTSAPGESTFRLDFVSKEVLCPTVSSAPAKQSTEGHAVLPTEMNIIHWPEEDTIMPEPDPTEAEIQPTTATTREWTMPTTTSKPVMHWTLQVSEDKSDLETKPSQESGDVPPVEAAKLSQEPKSTWSPSSSSTSEETTTTEFTEPPTLTMLVWHVDDFVDVHEGHTTDEERKELVTSTTAKIITEDRLEMQNSKEIIVDAELARSSHVKGHARPFGSSAVGMNTTPENSSPISTASWLMVLVCGLSLRLGLGLYT